MLRREVYRMDETGARALLAAAHAFQLASTTPDGYPVLRSLHGVVLDDALYFHGSPVGEKSEAIGRPVVVNVEEVVATIPSYFVDPRRACPATTYFQSAQVHGHIERVEDPAEKARMLTAFMAKYQPEGGFEPIDVENPLYRGTLNGLMVCRIPFERVDGKAKLGQNRRPEEIMGVLEGLWRRGKPGDVRAIEIVASFNQVTPPFLQAPEGARLVVAMGPAEVEAAADLLVDAYWNTAVSRDALVRSHLGSEVWVGAKDEAGRVIATARALSDGAKWAWIFDVMVAPDWRGRGIGQRLIRLLLDHPRLRHVANVRLATRDAQALYARYGFVDVADVPPKPYASTEMVLRRAAVPAEV